MERLASLWVTPTGFLLGRAGLDVLVARERSIPRRWPPLATASAARWPSSWLGRERTSPASSGSTPASQTSAPAATGDVKAPVLVCIGAEDPIVPPDQRAAFEEEMRAAGVDWRLVLYGGAAHSFTNPNAARMAMPGIEYNERADRRSWREMIDFFGEQFS